MGLNTFSTALSGLSTNSQGLNVIGNNLANLNTVGFKASNINFTDVLGQYFATKGTTQSGNVMSIGLGAQVSSVRTSMVQGSLQTTNNPLDIAIQGKGFLVVKNGGGQYYTRAGNLHVDTEGYLVSDSGAAVQGYTRNAAGQIDPTLGLTSVRLPSGTNNPVATSEFELNMNLDAGAVDGTKYAKSIMIYDSLGNKHMATLTFQKETDNSGATPIPKWNFDITIPNKEVAGADPASTEQFSLITGAVASADPDGGSFVFNSDGELSSAYIGTTPSTGALTNLTFPGTGVTLPGLANGGTLSDSFTWNIMKDPTTSNITGFASASDVSAIVQDGAPAGTLSNLQIGSDGIIAAIFDNGTATAVGQIVLAQFTNVDGLLSQGGGLYAESIASGPVLIGAPGEGGRGAFMSSTLEQSNVDMAAELTKIISFQRGYQASARMITVTDQILQETMNMRQ